MEALWQYVVIFVMAATPWLELLIVIPIGVAMGLSPFWVGLVALLGNALPVLLIVAGWQWWLRWRGKSGASRRAMKPRVQRVWDRWGLPGLALLGPLVTGIHLATVAALLLRSESRATMVWMTLSLVVWTVGTTAAAVGGVELFHRLAVS
nr:small multi-drug export protein [Alkalispirillum mobile]